MEDGGKIRVQGHPLVHRKVRPIWASCLRKDYNEVPGVRVTGKDAIERLEEKNKKEKTVEVITPFLFSIYCW